MLIAVKFHHIDIMMQTLCMTKNPDLIKNYNVGFQANSVNLQSGIYRAIERCEFLHIESYHNDESQILLEIWGPGIKLTRLISMHIDRIIQARINFGYLDSYSKKIYIIAKNCRRRKKPREIVACKIDKPREIVACKKSHDTEKIIICEKSLNLMLSFIFTSICFFGLLVVLNS